MGVFVLIHQKLCAYYTVFFAKLCYIRLRHMFVHVYIYA